MLLRTGIQAKQGSVLIKIRKYCFIAATIFKLWVLSLTLALAQKAGQALSRGNNSALIGLISYSVSLDGRCSQP